jgi:IS1 family transposase
MCTTGLKKTDQVWTNEQKFDVLELDELYWFIGQKGHGETRENVYLITMVSREPRQIVGFAVAYDKSPERIQGIVDTAPPALKYCTDGYLGYIDIVYPGRHVRNVHNKNDTFTVEGINADLRHYLPVLARRVRCFCRQLDTLIAVVAVFIDAYNKFGDAKAKHRVPVVHRPESTSRRLHKFREPPFSLLDFI